MARDPDYRDASGRCQLLYAGDVGVTTVPSTDANDCVAVVAKDHRVRVGDTVFEGFTDGKQFSAVDRRARSDGRGKLPHLGAGLSEVRVSRKFVLNGAISLGPSRGFRPERCKVDC